MSKDNILGKEFIHLRHTLMKLVSRIVPPKEVEDIVQEVYVRACTSKKKIDHPRSFMLMTAKNLSLDYLKSARVRLSVNLEEKQDHIDFLSEQGGDKTFQSVVSDQEFAEFCRITAALPRQARRAFVLKKVFGYSQREIATEMDISESTVEKHVALALLRCKQSMRPQTHTHPAKEEIGGDLEVTHG